MGLCSTQIRLGERIRTDRVHATITLRMLRRTAGSHMAKFIEGRGWQTCIRRHTPFRSLRSPKSRGFDRYRPHHLELRHVLGLKRRHAGARQRKLSSSPPPAINPALARPGSEELQMADHGTRVVYHASLCEATEPLDVSSQFATRFWLNCETAIGEAKELPGWIRAINLLVTWSAWRACLIRPGRCAHVGGGVRHHLPRLARFLFTVVGMTLVA